jgi:hypothetical protein
MEDCLTSANTRLFILSNERYPKRASKTIAHIKKQSGWISLLNPELRVGLSYEKRFAPLNDEMRTWPHWWAASCDHIDALENAIVSKCEYLLVFEDDAELSPEFDMEIKLTWESARDGWKAIRLGWNANEETGMIGTLWSRAGMIEAYCYFQAHRERVIDRAFADLRKLNPGGWYKTSRRIAAESSGSQQCGYCS